MRVYYSCLLSFQVQYALQHPHRMGDIELAGTVEGVWIDESMFAIYLLTLFTQKFMGDKIQVWRDG